MTRTRVLLGCLAAAAFVLDSNHAAAELRMTMPGAVCRANGASDTGTTSQGWFVSSSTQTAPVHCPVLRDHTDDPMKALFVRIQDSNVSSRIPWCGAFSYQNEGNAFDETELVDHTNPGGFDSLSIDVASLDLKSNHAVNVLCMVGQYDAVLSLRYIEE